MLSEEGFGGLARKSVSRMGRRGFLKLGGVAGLAVTGTLTGCGQVKTSSSGGGSTNRTIKIGYVTPQTGPLSAFGEADSFVIDALKEKFAQGIKIGDQTHPISVTVRNSESDPKRAADVASDLIQQDGIDLMLVASTPDTVNPVSDQCEANAVPCISTIAPWQAWFFGRGGKPDSPFKWTYHFFWGLDDIINVYSDMWADAGFRDVQVSALAPNDSDGKAWADPANGAFPLVEKAGYRILDGGRYENLTGDFSAQISRFKEADAKVLLGVPLPPDFTTFWKQAAQQGFKPEMATIAKALLFPSAVEALGPIGNNLGTEVWWSPEHPFTSSLTGQSARQLAGAYTSTTGKQWTQPIGVVHALFEVATHVLKTATSIDDKASIAEAIAKTKIDTVAGTIDFTTGPIKNAALTPLVGGQWRAKGSTYDLVVVNNKRQPKIPTGGRVERIS